MELTVGKLIKQGNKVDEEILERLSFVNKQIVEHNLIEGLDYKLIADARFLLADWSCQFHFELLQVYKWSLKRILHTALNNSRSPFERVICFQPYYGICVHYIRRVLPFVILGFNVTVIFEQSYLATGRQIADALNQLLGISKVHFISHTEVSQLPDDKRQLFLITGKISTYNILKQSFPKTTIYGALGQKALAIFSEAGKACQEFTAIYPSCTNVEESLILSDGLLRGSDGLTHPIDYVREVNPTLIYTNVAIDDNNILSLYKIIDCTQLAHAKFEGLCADPIHGYSGDYLI